MALAASLDMSFAESSGHGKYQHKEETIEAVY